MTRQFVTGSQDNGRGGIDLIVNGRPMNPQALQRAVMSQGISIDSSVALANKAASIALYQWVQRNFQSEGDMTAEGWPPLSERTIAWKAERGYSMMLQNTGLLRMSFLPFADAEGAGVGSAVWYSEQHQLGEREGDGPPLPQRRMLPDEDEAMELVFPIYERNVAVATSQEW